MRINAIGHVILSAHSVHALGEAFGLELGHKVKYEGVDHTVVQRCHEKAFEGGGRCVVEIFQHPCLSRQAVETGGACQIVRQQNAVPVVSKGHSTTFAILMCFQDPRKTGILKWS